MGRRDLLFPVSLFFLSVILHQGSSLRQGWLTPVSSYLLAFSELASLYPFSDIGTSWAVVHLRGWVLAVWSVSSDVLKYQYLQAALCRGRVSISVGLRLSEGPVIADCSGSWFHYDPAVQGYSVMHGRKGCYKETLVSSPKGITMWTPKPNAFWGSWGIDDT